MKRYLTYSILFLASSLFITSCAEDDPIINNDPGTVNFKFNHVVGEVPLQLNSIIYANDAGNVYSVSTLKYYISNIVLTQVDGTTYAPRSYNLIDAGLGDDDFSIIDVPQGTYKSISFSVGVDPVANSSGDQQGALDPLNGMFWSWSTGYIFTKTEGKYLNTPGDETNYLFHIGIDSNRIDKTVPVSFTIDGNKLTQGVNVKVDVNKFFNGSTTYDFEVDGDVTHTSNFPDRAYKIRQNMKNTFELTLAN